MSRPPVELFDEPVTEVCGHKRAELRRYILGNGGVQMRKQCLDCGAPASDPIRHATLERPVESYPEADKGLMERLHQEQLAAREARSEKRRAWYRNEYLQSAQWREKSALVLKRANHTCECCGTRRATQAHHLTYECVGEEPLWHLKAVCRECHEWLHGHDEAVAQ